MNNLNSETRVTEKYFNKCLGDVISNARDWNAKNKRKSKTDSSSQSESKTQKKSKTDSKTVKMKMST